MREWLASIVGESLAPIMTVILAAALVVLLALVLIGLAKRVFAGSGGIGGRSRAPRLAVLDMAPVDPKRKLVLVRRDDVEHLILIGGQNDLVVEPGIVRGQARRPRQEPGFAEAEQRAAPAPAPAQASQPPLPHRRTPRPVVQPVPYDGQELGAHAPIAPVAEARVAPAPEPRVEPAPRAPAVSAERAEAHRAPAVVPPVASVALQQRAEPPIVPTAPVVVPPAAASVPDGPSTARTADAASLARPTEPRFPPEPVPASRRGHEMAAEPVSASLPTTRPAQAGTPIETAPRGPDIPPVAPERVEPVFASPEPSRQGPIVPPVQAQRPVAPPIAQTVTPQASIPAPSALAQSAQPTRPNVPSSAPVATPAGQAASPAPAPAAPRSMATPTLPQMSRATPAPSQPREEIQTTASRSLWSTAPNVTVSPLTNAPAGDRSDRTERDAPQPNVAPAFGALPERVPVRWPPAPLSPGADNAAKAEGGSAGPVAGGSEPTPAPLSVKSFATTIQERRTPAPTDAPAPVAPMPRPPVAPPVVEATPNAAPVSAPPAPVSAPPVPVPESEPDGPGATESERPLTLEEEMERLLHDFTIDVSERR